jgi:hypothetical protein
VRQLGGMWSSSSRNRPGTPSRPRSAA